jgi:hypothetical protein
VGAGRGPFGGHGAPSTPHTTRTPWLRRSRCLPTARAELVGRMADRWDWSADPDTPQSPAVCGAASPSPRGSDVRPPRPAPPGGPARDEDADRREGTGTLARCLPPGRGWRPVTGTGRRPASDCAPGRQDVGDGPCPRATRLRGVLDHRTTQTPAAFSATCAPAAARRSLRQLDGRSTPKPGRGRSRAAMACAVVTTPGLNQRRPAHVTVGQQSAAWQPCRQGAPAPGPWQVTTAQARRTRKGRDPVEAV